LGRRMRPIDTAGMYNVMGVTGGVFGDTEVASCRRGSTRHAMEFVDRPL